MTNAELFNLNARVQKALNELPVDTLVEMTASELHEIWKVSTYIKDDKGNVVMDENGKPKQIEKWKKLDPTESPEEEKYVAAILRDPRFLTLPYIRKEPDGAISINIAKMNFNQLSPHWQKENHDAAEVAVEMTLDNYVYLADPVHREVLIHAIGSAIHVLWKNRPANAWAKGTEMAERYTNLTPHLQAEDYRHIFMAEKSIEFLAKKLNIDLGKEMNKLNSKKPKH